MSAIEIIEFVCQPGTTAQALQGALDALDAELIAVGGYESKELFSDADTENRWILAYRWSTVAAAKGSMTKVADTAAFKELMALVHAPETMKMSYGTTSAPDRPVSVSAR